ncbi:MAG TPA: GIY-YIG nuclease family protein [Bryobacteraceae bacterium]|nr:GIY-YIG nuclease family protein [Bryobacteraceae bacterium]
MNTDFQNAISGLEGKCAMLLAMQPVAVAEAKGIGSVAGVYLLSQGTKHLYVGRSNNIRRRLRLHCQGARNQAPLAKQLAMLHLSQAGVPLPSAYRKGNKEFYGTDPQFCRAFKNAKVTVASSSVRFVEEREPVAQALLEIYVALAMKTPFNDFDVH